MALRTASPALPAYEAMAATYDAFTAGYDHDRWLQRIVSLARGHGLHGTTALDIGCGTGKSAAPLVALGFSVTAVDVSPSMAALATRRLGRSADVRVADMRHLDASLGRFDLLTCLDDAINYLTDADDLRAAFAAARRVLAPEGVYVFDVNTLHAYALAFDQDFVTETDSVVFCWSARTDAETAGEPDSVHEAQLDTFRPGAEGTWTRQTGTHRQRHFSHETITSALSAEGLRCIDVLGQSPGIRLSRPADEARHTKRLYVASHEAFTPEGN
jgi:ubiquinone/menaquinone biosynthesis C-methylase UbiE